MKTAKNPALTPLSGLDASFLYLETEQTPMHVGSLNLFELPEGYEGDFREDLKAHIEARLHLLPVLTRKLVLMPLQLTSPMWVEDDAFDIDRHIIAHRLPRPGTMAQLERLVGKLHAGVMSRDRPLWEFHVITGLKDGQVGFFSRLHHAAVDGQAGVALANAILDLTPVPRPVPAGRRRSAPRHELGVAELLGAALANQLQQFTQLARLLPGAAKAASGTAAKALAAAVQKPAGSASRSKSNSGAEPARSNWKLGPRTPLNVNVGTGRVFATASLPIADLKAAGKPHGATINDMVLALCSGALRRYLLEIDALPVKSLTAAVPVSLRSAGDTAANNQATLTLVNLATDIADPLLRLRFVCASAAAMKATVGSVKSAIPTDFPSIGLSWALSGLTALYGKSRLANRIPALANVVISNVPGPQMPLYLAGARMTAYHPASIIVHGIALNITVQSYLGSLYFGITGCSDAVPDVRKIAKYLLVSARELDRLAGTGGTAGKVTAAKAAKVS